MWDVTLSATPQHLVRAQHRWTPPRPPRRHLRGMARPYIDVESTPGLVWQAAWEWGVGDGNARVLDLSLEG